jgi:hypothetical protein
VKKDRLLLLKLQSQHQQKSQQRRLQSKWNQIREVY